MTTETGIGASVRRKEDKRFIIGKGRYLDDITKPGQTYGYFIRSPYAHAKINSIDTSEALKAPGIVDILTGPDMEADGIGPIICGWGITSKDGTPHKAPAHPALAVSHVKYVGHQVALVVAETLQQARDAAELVEIDYEELPHVIEVGDALASDAPQIHDDIPGNLSFDWEIGDRAAAEQAIASAHHVTRMDLRNNRLIPNAMEPRAALGEYDAGTDEITLYTTSQNPHVHRLVLSAFNAVAPEHKLRVIAPDVGGGFGSKIFIYSEETVCAWATKKLDRPIKWTADRSESFLSDAHGRDHETHAEMAFDADGKILGFKVSTKANVGCYLSTFASAVPTYLYGTLLNGQYTMPAIYCEVQAGFTNTAPVDAYRGAGRPEATYVVERMIEIGAREMGIDPGEIRKRNFIPPDAYPYETPVIMAYDSGNYALAMDKAQAAIDYSSFEARKAESAQRGKLRGIGYSAFIEACGIAPSAAVGSLGAGVGLWESAQVRFNPTGSVTVFTGSHSHGQGHETTFAQIVSDQLGVPIDQVEISHGDTGKVPFGMGTYGSRSLAVGGSAIMKAIDKVVEKSKKIAAHTLEASVEDIEHSGGVFSVAGTDKKMTMAEIAFSAYVPHNYPADVEPGMDETAFYDPLNFTFPAGTHIAEVEIDPETGTTEILDWVAVDDFGNVINPMIVEGQVHGGLAQGIGQALLENCVYDKESGQLLTGSYMDYCMPRADDLPTFRVETINTPCTTNPLGVKGCGEAGAISAPAALMNAITNALGKEIDMPATPEKVWRAAQGL
ncbi:xanthine dehydrogenase family protein molybdopterin-binding subunit [Kiloniella majae]|uniref:xanthine dehydrogenase family protein molybdopterin-binding subunit n=1 Tax=Kiloniella majae TaxID=1938558 RepID=UPI000A277C0D|nr:xanthine dehydrogenase family protein molybdopterin-binding subunit [Kiloniella majae]